MEHLKIFCYMQMSYGILDKARWQITHELNLSHRELSRGVQATSVISIEPPTTAAATLADFENIADEDVFLFTLEAARVKWFDKAKGFCFANIWQSSEDVFIHVEILRRSGLADLQAGEAVAIRVIAGKRGKMAAEVCSWESVSPD